MQEKRERKTGLPPSKRSFNITSLTHRPIIQDPREFLLQGPSSQSLIGVSPSSSPSASSTIYSSSTKSSTSSSVGSVASCCLCSSIFFSAFPSSTWVVILLLVMTALHSSFGFFSVLALKLLDDLSANFFASCPTWTSRFFMADSVLFWLVPHGYNIQIHELYHKLYILQPAKQKNVKYVHNEFELATYLVFQSMPQLPFGPLFLYTNMFKGNPVCRKAHRIVKYLKIKTDESEYRTHGTSLRKG
ncbi:hypothetical protein GmHk_20G057063 [Glycine max]|nr:hypothetical protein GmHk_20G057063 [Glycine max]